MFEMPQKTESRHTGSILFIVLAIILLAAGVLFIAFACRSYFRYQQYGRAVEYTFGSTSQVVATLEDGTRVRLSDHNRTVLYSMLTDSSGQRHESGGETGDSFEFYASSAVGTAIATVADAGDGWVYVHMMRAGTTISKTARIMTCGCGRSHPTAGWSRTPSSKTRWVKTPPSRSG